MMFLSLRLPWRAAFESTRQAAGAATEKVVGILMPLVLAAQCADRSCSTPFVRCVHFRTLFALDILNGTQRQNRLFWRSFDAANGCTCLAITPFGRTPPSVQVNVHMTLDILGLC